MSLPLDETPEQTTQRLHRLAHDELAASLAAGGIDATAMDGSLSSGRLWPSSDLDLTVVPSTGTEWGVEWGVREGVVVHKHLNRWPVLQRLRDGYPESFIEAASSDWMRDANWMLDGVASIQPVHDPEGRLQAMSGFFRAHRFAPEVVLPRRPLLLARADAFAAEAAQAFEGGDPLAGESVLEIGLEAVALVWLEAAERIISLKELDPALADACAALGAPEAHSLFRATAGVAGLEARVPALLPAARRLLDLYSGWVDALPPEAGAPGVIGSIGDSLGYRVWFRHRIWSMIYAPERGCYLHLASVRQQLVRQEVEEWEAFAARWTPAGSSPLADYGALRRARAALLDAFPLAPPAERLHAFDALRRLTAARFDLPG
jgi:hypothetical protein